MNETAVVEPATPDEHAVQARATTEIDALIKELSGRGLADTSSVIDRLLDIRTILSN